MKDSAYHEDYSSLSSVTASSCSELTVILLHCWLVYWLVQTERTPNWYQKKKGKESCERLWLRHELSLYHNCNSTTIQLRYDNTTTHSTTMEVIEITIRVRFDCDTTMIWLQTKNWHVHFLLASNWKQARAIHRSRIVALHIRQWWQGPHDIFELATTHQNTPV